MELSRWFVTITLIVLNVLIFLYQWILPPYVQKQFVMTFAPLVAERFSRRFSVS